MAAMTQLRKRAGALHGEGGRHRLLAGSGCGSGSLIENHRERANQSEERASGKYLEILETQEPPAGVEPATY